MTTPPRDPDGAAPRSALSSGWAALQRRWIAASIALGLLLALPSVASGFFADDYFFLLGLETESPVIPSHFDLYRFADGVPAHVRWMMDHGPLPWWTKPDLHILFFRPLGSALLAADHALFGRWAAGYHVHELLWYALLLAAVAALYRRLPSAGLASSSMLLFVVDDCHPQAYGWISSRHAVVSAAFAVLGLVAHLRAREDGWRAGRALAPLAFAAALAAGEVGLTAMAYVAAYEAFAAPGTRPERARALAPFALLLVAYVALYRALGCGVSGSGTYLDPTRDPGQYALAFVPRLLALLAALWTPVPADLWMVDPLAKAALVAAGSGAAVFMALVLHGAYADLAPDEARHVRWLGAGALLSLLPVAAGALTNRLVLVASVGGAVLVAVAIRHAWRGLRREGSRRLRHGAVLVVLAGVHLVIALASSLGAPLLARMASTEMERVTRAAEFEAGQKVVLVAASNQLMSYFPAFIAGCDPAHAPGAWWMLSMAPRAHRVTRTGERTVELEVLDATLFESDLELLFRPRHASVAPGDRFAAGGYEIRVLETEDGRPHRIEARFDTSLDDPSLRLLAWRDGRLGRVSLDEGESLVIPRSPIWR